MTFPRSVQIIDPGLVSVAGHNLTQDMAIALECKRRNIPVSIYCRTGANLDITGVNILEAFRTSIFSEPKPQQPQFAVFESYFLMNRVFFQDLNAIPITQLCFDDLLYFPNLTHNQLEGVTDWICSAPTEHRPKLAITLRYLSWQMQYNQVRGYGPAIQLLYSHILPKLLERHPQTYLFSDTTVLSDHFSRVSGASVVTLPIPQATLAPKTTRTNLASPQALSLLYIGGWGDVHGSCFLPAVVRSVLETFSNVTITIQVNADHESKAADAITMRMLAETYAPRLNILLGQLTNERYLIEMRNADIVLLPYQPTNYQFASSGVLTEAAASGKVLVVTAGTTLESTVRSYRLGAVIIDNFSEDSFVRAVNSAIENFAELDAQANATYEAFARDNSPQGFLDKMLAHINHHTNEVH